MELSKQRSAEEDGTQAIADALEVRNDIEHFTFNGMTVTVDPHCPPGMIYRVPDRHECIVHDAIDFYMNYNEAKRRKTN